MTTSEQIQKCANCGTENSINALFCQNCAEPLNKKGIEKKLGWKPVMWNFFMPGLGQYRQGRRKLGLILMGLFLFCLVMYLVSSTQAAMNTLNSTFMEDGNISIEALEESMESNKGIMLSIYSWGYWLIWLGSMIEAFISIKKKS